jgi:hypothetical protein
MEEGVNRAGMRHPTRNLGSPNNPLAIAIHLRIYVDWLSPPEDAWRGLLRRARRRASGKAALGGEAVLRRLAAIVAAGDSRLMEAGAEGTLARLGSLRHDLIDPKIALDKGDALKATGAVRAG